MSAKKTLGMLVLITFSFLWTGSSCLAQEFSYTTETLAVTQWPNGKRMWGELLEKNKKPLAYYEMALIALKPDMDRHCYDVFHFKTGKDGSFDLGIVPTGDYNLLYTLPPSQYGMRKVSADGRRHRVIVSNPYCESYTPLASAPPVIVQHLTFPLTTVRGQLIFANTKAPAPHIAVRVNRSDLLKEENLPFWFNNSHPFKKSGNGQTDENGCFEIKDCPLGNVCLNVAGKDVVNEQVASGRTQKDAVTDWGDVSIEGAFNLKFRLIDAKTSAPVLPYKPRNCNTPNLKVGILTTTGKYVNPRGEDIESQPDTQGNVELHAIPTSANQVYIHYNQFLPQRIQLDRKKIQPGATVNLGDVKMDPGRSVHFALDFPDACVGTSILLFASYVTRCDGPDVGKSFEGLPPAPDVLFQKNQGETSGKEVVMSGFLPGIVTLEVLPTTWQFSYGIKENAPVFLKNEAVYHKIEIKDSEDTVVHISVPAETRK